MAIPEITNKDWSKELKAYKVFMGRKGYNIIYDGSKPTEDSGVLFVIYSENKDNPKEPYYTFFDIFMGGELSVEGFVRTVVEKQNPDEFVKMIEARIKGCTITKSDMIYGLLDSDQYNIDDIYVNGNIKVSPKALRTLSQWVNFKGGKHPELKKKIEQVKSATKR